jgi:hypothetical protein
MLEDLEKGNWWLLEHWHASQTASGVDSLEKASLFSSKTFNYNHGRMAQTFMPPIYWGFDGTQDTLGCRLLQGRKWVESSHTSAVLNSSAHGQILNHEKIRMIFNKNTIVSSEMMNGHKFLFRARHIQEIPTEQIAIWWWRPVRVESRSFSRDKG